MSYISERVAYLDGLAEGLKLKEDDQGKILSGIIDVLHEIASDLEERDEVQEDVLDALDELYDSVDEINDCLDDLDCESCPSADCDWEEDDEYYDDEDDDDGIEVLCPYCHETVVFDEDEFLREDMLICPNCGKKIDPEDLEEDPDDDDDIKF